MVELLVVIGVIGVLVGLLLPAIQAAQESARRTTCANNLKQHALAIINHIDAHSTYPLGLSEVTGWAWSARILPFNEGEDIYSQLDLNQKVGIAGGNRTAINNVKIANIRCPSAKGMPDFMKNFNGEAMTHWVASVPTASYQGNYGPLHTEGNSASYPVESQCCVNGGIGFMGFRSEFRGIFALSGKPVVPKQVTDGLSKTFLLGENNFGNGSPSGAAGVGLWLGSVDCGNSSTNNGKINNINAFLRCCLYQMNKWYGDGRDTRGFGSMHGNGAQMAFCDGAVKFIKDDIQHTESASSSFTSASGLASVGVYQLLSCRDDDRPTAISY